MWEQGHSMVERRQTGYIWLTDVLSKERELTDNWKEPKVILKADHGGLNKTDKDLSPNDLNSGLFLTVNTAFATEGFKSWPCLGQK